MRTSTEETKADMSGTPPPELDDDNAPPAASVKVPLWMLALLTFSGTLAMHIFVPALSIAEADLGGGVAAMQMTISVYILGLAFGQLIYGPLSDRFGRRPVLMVGLVLYTAAGLAAALAPNVHALIAARLFQAVGGCAGLVLARAILRDTSAPKDATRRLALMNLMVTMGPGAAPILGGALALAAGWRSIFVLLTLLGLVNFLLTWLLLPETGRPMEGGIRQLMKNYGLLLRSPAFWGYAVGGGCATTSFFAFVSAAPFIFINELHKPASDVGIYVAVLIMGFLVGSILASRLITYISIRRLLVLGNAASVVAAFTLLAIVVSGQLTVAAAVASMFLFTTGAGVASPAALSEALSVRQKVIGSASGLYGAIQMTVGAICTALASMGSDPAFAAALVLSASGITAQLAFWIAGRLRQPTG